MTTEMQTDVEQTEGGVAVASSVLLGGWLPISQAPKDGTPIYVWQPSWNGRGPLVRTAWWGTDDAGFWANDLLNGSMPENFKPEWWMHIPNPPNDKSDSR